MTEPINLENLRKQKMTADYKEAQRKVIQEILDSDDAAEQVFLVMMEIARLKNTFLHMAVISEEQYMKGSYRNYKDGIQSVIGGAMQMPFKHVLAEAKGMQENDSTGTD